MKLIVTRPQHDITTKYISAWANEIILLAQKKSIEVIDLFRHKANRKELEGRISKVAPSIIFLNGHGSDDRVCGHDNEVLIQAGDNDDYLGGKITYALSCDSGKVLGEAVAKREHTAYIGYADEFIFACNKNHINKPIQDPVAKPFMDASNQVMASIIKGHTVQEASDRSKNIFNENYIKLSSSIADPDSLQAAQFLWWNMRNQVCLGDTDTRVSVSTI